MQYQDGGIPEYWIVDPNIQTVLVLQLTGTTYTEVGSFTGHEQIRSPLFEQLNLTAAQLFGLTWEEDAQVVADRFQVMTQLNKELDTQRKREKRNAEELIKKAKLAEEKAEYER